MNMARIFGAFLHIVPTYQNYQVGLVSQDTTIIYQPWMIDQRDTTIIYQY